MPLNMPAAEEQVTERAACAAGYLAPADSTSWTAVPSAEGTVSQRSAMQRC